jgi:hypothetical protein
LFLSSAIYQKRKQQLFSSCSVSKTSNVSATEKLRSQTKQRGENVLFPIHHLHSMLESGIQLTYITENYIVEIINTIYYSQLHGLWHQMETRGSHSFKNTLHWPEVWNNTEFRAEITEHICYSRDLQSVNSVL